MKKEIRFYIREDEYGFLSNFWKYPMTVDYGGLKQVYNTNEHFYQSQKAYTTIMREWIRTAPTAYAAMIAGRNLRPYEIVPGWENNKIDVMRKGLEYKFKNENLRLMLLWTGDAILIEDSPTDMFWGGKLEGSKNMLGTLLMEIRDKIKRNM
jgi:ribA/ribD-fused uncharacterized protein